MRVILHHLRVTFILNDLAADPTHAATPSLAVVDDTGVVSAPDDVSFSDLTARLPRRWDIDLASVALILTLG